MFKLCARTELSERWNRDSFKVLTTVKKNTILRVARFLDLPLVNEMIDLSFKICVAWLLNKFAKY